MLVYLSDGMDYEISPVLKKNDEPDGSRRRPSGRMRRDLRLVRGNLLGQRQLHEDAMDLHRRR